MSGRQEGSCKHCHLVYENPEPVYFRFLCSPSHNRPFSIIVNSVFNKSSKEFNSILKIETETPNKNVPKCCGCTKETQTSSLFERRGSFDMHVRAMCQKAG